MAQRHSIAIAAGETTDLIDLAEMLTICVKEVIDEDKMPYKDPAVRLVCFQIAFAGNGDNSFYLHYEDIYRFCVATVHQDQQGFPSKDKPIEPLYKAS